MGNTLHTLLGIVTSWAAHYPVVENTLSVPLQVEVDKVDKYSTESPEEEGTGIYRPRLLVQWLGFVVVEGVVVGGGRLRDGGGGRLRRGRGLR